MKSLWRLVLFVLLSIMLGQGVWIYYMYESYKQEFVWTIENSLANAVYMEISGRNEQLGGVISFAPYDVQDTSRYIRKKITSADTVFWVNIDRYDKYSTLKLAQFLIKDLLPIDIAKLDTLFRQEIGNSRYQIGNTYVEYIDLKDNRIIRSDKPKSLSGSYVSTREIPIDINNSQGVRAYAEVPSNAILRDMTIQLILSGSLILITLCCIFYLFYIISEQKKIEKMRQSSVNAMTHEFKRPISVAVTLANLIPIYKKDKNKTDRYSKNICQELNKLTSYTEQIQQISKSEKAELQLNKSEVNIRDFFSALKTKYTGTENDKADLQILLEVKRKSFYIDPVHFANVMDNLVENAIKYSEGKANVTVHVFERKGRLLISVKDKGVGMSWIDKNHIFERYYRSNHKEVQQKPGFGLGLTYVKLIVKGHDGTIRVKSRLGEGSKFIIEIPWTAYVET